MIPTTEQLQGIWLTECMELEHLSDLGCVIQFYFDQLPFDEYNLLRITSTIEKQEKVIVSGEYSLEQMGEDSFIIICQGKRIICKQFNEITFVATLEDFGEMILIKHTQ